MKEIIHAEDQNMPYSVRCFEEDAKMSLKNNYITNLEFSYKLNTK